MKELELKHIAPYLPYGLYVVGKDDQKEVIGNIQHLELSRNEVLVWNDKHKDGWLYALTDIKPMLRPLSSMSIEENEELNGLINDTVVICVSSGNWLYIEGFNNDPWAGSSTLSMASINKINKYLLSNHFDIFRLIDKGLATDKNVRL